jgi:hypothetical protein
VGSELVGTGQYNGLRETSFLCSPIRGDVGLTGVELVSAFDCLDSARRMLVFFFNVA